MQRDVLQSLKRDERKEGEEYADSELAILHNILQSRSHVNIYVYKYIILPMQYCANSFQTVTETSVQQWIIFHL